MLPARLAFLLVLLTPAPCRAGGAFNHRELEESNRAMEEARLSSTLELRGTLTQAATLAIQIEPGHEAEAMQAAERQLLDISKALLPSIRSLDALRKSYSKLSDLSAAEAQRAELRAGLLEKQRRYEEQFAIFEAVTRTRLTLGMAGLASKRPLGELFTDFQDAAHVSKFYRKYKAFKFRLRKSLGAEEEAYALRKRSLQEELARRRALRRAAAAGGAGLLGLGGAALWLLRRRRGGRPSGPPGPGAVIGGSYRLERELGRGGMGLVFEATDLGLRRKVAIKQLRSELQQSPRDLEMFLAEARLVAALQHPHVVEIYAIVQDRSGLHLVFELVEGRPLSLELERAGRLQPDALRALARQVGAALDYAHSRGIVHRDLKPANVMLTAQGTAKVMDFGLAQRATATVARLTRAKTWGTPPYMAPEHELGTASPASDLFSLGVMLYEAATGKRPFPGPNHLAQKREQPPVPPSEAAPGLPKCFDAALARALDPDPDKRFRSCGELIAALEGP